MGAAKYAIGLMVGGAVFAWVGIKGLFLSDGPAHTEDSAILAILIPVGVVMSVWGVREFRNKSDFFK